MKIDVFRNSLMVVQETALRRAGKMIFDECLWTTQPAGRPLDRLPLGSPKGVSLAGAGELLFDASSTETTLSCSSTVEFGKKSNEEVCVRSLI
jgi:hypothetical protein